MRTIERTTAFRRDYKREMKGPHGDKLEKLMRGVLALLVDDNPLSAANRDHPLTGRWKDFRDCHLRPDLILIYRKPDADTLQLV